jgi:hypothetical protein
LFYQEKNSGIITNINCLSVLEVPIESGASDPTLEEGVVRVVAVVGGTG